MPRQMTITLRCKVGPHAGQVLEYPKHVGEALLDSGQAEWPERVEERPLPRAETPESPDLSSLSKEELVALAGARGVDVVRADGEDGPPLKSDYVQALAGG